MTYYGYAPGHDIIPYPLLLITYYLLLARNAITTMFIWSKLEKFAYQAHYAP